MAELSKERAIAEYKRLKLKFGHQPSSKEFFDEKTISNRDLGKLFGAKAYSKLTKSAGDEPKIPFHLRPDKLTPERMLENWGNFIKERGHKPTQAEWSHFGYSPTAQTYGEKFGKWEVDLPKAFIEFAKDKPEWKNVIGILSPENSSLPDEPSAEVGQALDFKGFIPPIIKEFGNLAVKEGSNIEFEKMVNLVFQILGFRVTRLGQGTGRNSDGIAIDKENHYAVFLDAKARKDGYAVGTDDRAFIEYVRTWENKLESDGIKQLYFVVVSSRFKGSAGRAIKNLKNETGIKSLVMISAELLLRIVAAKIQFPAEFSLKAFKDELLVQDGEIEPKKVEQWITSSISKCNT